MIRWCLLVTIMCLLSSVVAVADGNTQGKALFSRCAACHMADGTGVAGIFPPLKSEVIKMASTEVGRSYLVQVVKFGTMGRITVNGVPYSGVMPAQGSTLDNAAISQILNYLVEDINDILVPKEWVAFSEQEVTTILQKNPDKTFQQVNQLRHRLTN